MACKSPPMASPLLKIPDSGPTPEDQALTREKPTRFFRGGFLLPHFGHMHFALAIALPQTPDSSGSCSLIKPHVSKLRVC